MARHPRRGGTTRQTAPQLARRNQHPHAIWPPPRPHRHNLPTQLTSFIGRECEIAEIKRLLSAAPLVTLTGSGGCGKTRLVLQVAADILESFPDGVWFAELAPLSDPAFVPKAVASVLDIPEQPHRTMTETLADRLQTKKALLLLDNCEHLRSACQGLIETLLRAGAAVRILATSREALGVEGELTYHVPSLRLPDARQPSAVTQLAENEAIRLFVERAALVRPEFALTEGNAGFVMQICWRLDGMPLAIELAAAQMRMLSIEQITARLDDRFRLLTGGSRTALPRRETLQATMDWSYGLLSDSERLLWRRLAVFSGGFTLEAAESVCTGGGIGTPDILSLLTSLVDKSLVIAEIHGREARYRLLETVRQYGWGKLEESKATGDVRTRHLDWYLELAEQVEPGLWGIEQRLWLERLETERGNLHAALEWSKTEGRGPETTLRLAGALWRFWFVRGYWSEGRSWLGAGLPADGSASLSTQAKALIGAGFLAWCQDDYKTAAALGEQSLGLCRTLEDKRGIVLSLHNVATAARFEGDYGRLAALGAESLRISQELHDRLCIALSLFVLAWDARRQCKHQEAMALYEESVRLCRVLGDDWNAGRILIERGHVALIIGDCRAATASYEECLGLFRKLGHKRGIAAALAALGRVAVRKGNYKRAKALCQQSLTLAVEVASQYLIARSQTVLADAVRGQGAYAEAVRLYKESIILHHRLRARPEIPLLLERLAATTRRKQPKAAACLYATAAALRDAIGAPLPPSARVDVDHDVAATERVVGKEAFAAAWAQGRSMTLEQAVEWTMALPDGPVSYRSVKTRDRAVDGAAPLAPREQEVAVLISEGLSNRDIAARLSISERTAETHVQHILDKLGCNSRVRIATWAAQRGLTAR